MVSIKEKLINFKDHGNFRPNKYSATLVFKDTYGKKRIERLNFQEKPSKTMKLDHNITAKITNVKRLK